ncbi:N-formylglutamate amidohydrolase [Pandoraea apista]|uniref:N-formylglutamate amidohydrolase n=1 Tax=Pandoraea apista TaxID=93218 RepID=A0A5E5NZJ6_9BURK|nr:N-formylglutamate amidohydrolase [Pandoraea apista]AJE98607.1 N-formylglutamate amidohydrolase [Pandoraea apista]AKH72674.1 N-formylglutamate amidohydrolase [Pandoraea apista]AKI61060.1 N-formylglutamate amidohydrolase [Pandoraea apista]ALS65879.1 N-formylglutamate amidohydrolase [Pandoraea apista]AVF39253.1 N-formylglutamate amidohydrolase [Pandoraea apista]
MSRQVTEGRYFVEAPQGGLGRRLPLVIDAPHSGHVLPADFDTIAPTAAILACGDAYVDELWSIATHHGATLVAALFPRAYIDPNRAEHDIDPELLASLWPHDARPQPTSERGVGLLHRFAAPNVPLYDRRLSVAEVERRIHDYYLPYRHALRDALDTAWRRYGVVWHLDCHSMRSRGGALDPDAGLLRADVRISDGGGTTADPAFSRWVIAEFTRLGYRVAYNTPGHLDGREDLVRHFGRPAERRHSVQIELNQSLYLNESSGEKHDGFATLQSQLGKFAAALAAYAEQHSEEV